MTGQFHKCVEDSDKTRSIKKIPMLKADLMKRLTENGSEDSDSLIDIESEGEDESDSPCKPIKAKPKESPVKTDASISKVSSN